MKVKSESEVAQLCPTLGNLVDCSLPGSALHGIFQARVLEWDAIAFSVIYPILWELKELHFHGGIRMGIERYLNDTHKFENGPGCISV